MKTALSINQPFKDWVNHLKQDIRSAQIKAAVRVNSELLHLYWQQQNLSPLLNLVHRR